MKVRRIDFSPDEWLSGAARLKADERGCYITICAMIYSEGGAIADDSDLVPLLKVHPLRWNSIRARLVALDKIQIEGGMISQRRCSVELGKAESRTSKAVEHGERGGRRSGEVRAERAKNKHLAEADASISEKLTINHQPSTTKPPTPKGDFERWYEVYPLKKNPDAAERAFKAALKRGATVDDLIASALRYAEEKADDLADKTRRRFVQHPATWLNGGAWKSEPEPDVLAIDAVDSLLSLWKGRLAMWRSDNTWLGTWGPQPGQPQCQVPRELLLEPTAAGGML